MSTGETQPRAAELAVGRRWTFGLAVLDERTLELTVNGEPARVERKPLEVLLYLLHHAGEVVTKDELADNLWPGRILTETVLTRCISQLRQVLKDEERTVIRTVHGFGYRLVAEVKVDATTAPVLPAFSFEPGQNPPLRPHWRLVERLGTGGHGEAWLAQQDKTRDQRVFKFALDAGGLAALKREITLYRLLNDTLGDRAPAVRLLEWNLEEAPYFIETEYVEGRDLGAWAAARGGLAGMPLEQRLDVIAQVAEALVAAHSVGVLHKDLKPGNVLVHDIGGRPTVKLSDFGSGGVMDVERLEKLGITRMGFTKTATTTSATPLYVAPEVMSGQPSTVPADIYALGVMLYQVVVGDFRKALAPGWELDVSDELLREDIAAAAAGDPSRRLADAAQLVERLRSLEARRNTRAADVAARERSERARRALTELKRTRVFAMLLLALAASAVATGLIAYNARNQAFSATAAARGVSDFLLEDVLNVDPSLENPRDASYESLLNRAAARVDKRFASSPQDAASIHLLLGRRYAAIAMEEAAIPQYERAVALFTQMHGRGGEATLLALETLPLLYADHGRIPEALSVSRELRERWTALHGPADLSTLMLRTRIARAVAFAGDLDQAESELRDVLQAIPHAERIDQRHAQLLKQWFGIAVSDKLIPEAVSAFANAYLAANVLGEYGQDFAEAELRIRQSATAFGSILGQGAEPTSLTRMSLAGVLTYRGQYEEAEYLSLQARDFFDARLPAKHPLRGVTRLVLARLRLEQRRPKEALAFIKDALEFCSPERCSERIRAEHLWDLGRAYDELGKRNDAVSVLRTALSMYEMARGPDHVGTLRLRVSLADALRKSGKHADAAAVLALVRPQAIAGRPRHPVVADIRRVQGLLLLHERKFEDARGPLQESLDVLTDRLGPLHWRTERARMELDSDLEQ